MWLRCATAMSFLILGSRISWTFPQAVLEKHRLLMWGLACKTYRMEAQTRKCALCLQADIPKRELHFTRKEEEVNDDALAQYVPHSPYSW